MSYIKKNLLNFIIIVFGCASVLIINNKADNILDINSNTINTRPDNTFSEVKYIAMDNEGKPLYTVSSSKHEAIFCK